MNSLGIRAFLLRWATRFRTSSWKTVRRKANRLMLIQLCRLAEAMTAQSYWKGSQLRLWRDQAVQLNIWIRHGSPSVIRCVSCTTLHHYTSEMFNIVTWEQPQRKTNSLSHASYQARSDLQSFERINGHSKGGSTVKHHLPPRQHDFCWCGYF